VTSRDIVQVPSVAQRLAKRTLRSLVAAPLLVESKIFGVLIAARRQPESFSSGECEFLAGERAVALATHQAQCIPLLQQAYDDLRQRRAVMQQDACWPGQMASGIAHDINKQFRRTLTPSRCLEREPADGHAAIS